MDTETLNEYLFADLVTQWATRIARTRTSSPDADPLSVTAEDLRAALGQLEMRRRVVRALSEGAA